MTLSWHEVGEVALPVVPVGAFDGHPVLLLPGLTDGLTPLTDPDARAHLVSPPAALRADYRVHVASHRFPMDDRPSTAALARDAAAVLERLTDRPATLVGHSMGAMVAQHLAADRPELVSRMVLSCTVGRADATFRRALEGWAELVVAERWTDLYRSAVDLSYTGSAWLSRRVAQRVLPVKVPTAEQAARHLALTHACVTHDALDRLGGIAVPVLVLAGGSWRTPSRPGSSAPDTGGRRRHGSRCRLRSPIAAASSRPTGCVTGTATPTARWSGPSTVTSRTFPTWWCDPSTPMTSSGCSTGPELRGSASCPTAAGPRSSVACPHRAVPA